MSTFDILREKILNYFPPVSMNIINIYEEMITSYNTYVADIPLKHLIHGEVYSPEILKTLQTVRILLRSTLDKARFIYELNLLVKSWGKDGFYKKSILKQELVDLIKKIHIVYFNEEKERENMKYAEEISINYKLNNLSDELTNLKFKNNITKLPNRPRTIINKNKDNNKNKNFKKTIFINNQMNDLDLSNLKIK